MFCIGKVVTAATVAGLSRPKGVTSAGRGLVISQMNISFVTATDPHTVFRKQYATSNPVAQRQVAVARYDATLLLLCHVACNPKVLNNCVKVDWAQSSHMAKVVQFWREVEDYQPDVYIYLVKAGWEERHTGVVSVLEVLEFLVQVLSIWCILASFLV